MPQPSDKPPNRDKPRLKSAVLAPPENWMEEWIAPVLSRHAQIEQVYLLGDRARGPHGQKPDYSLLLYAGYDNALELLTRLARDESEYFTRDGIVHLYVENYGATFCGIWGGALIPNEVNRDWSDGHDYLLWIERGDSARPLSERLRLPLERRIGDRRAARGHMSTLSTTLPAPRDDLPPLFPRAPQASETSERRNTDRRRDLRELLPLLSN